MAYQIKRKNRVVEKLELCNADGSVALAVDVDINVDDMGGKIAAAQDVLAMAKELVQKEPKSEKAQEAFGTAVMALFAVIFGQENTISILKFYDGRYIGMLADVFPFIKDVIMPKIIAVSAERKQQILDTMRKR